MASHQLIRKFLPTNRETVLYKNDSTRVQRVSGITLCNQTAEERSVSFFISDRTLKAGAILFDIKFEPSETFVIPEKYLFERS